MARLRDLAALIGRIGLGIVFIAHGWQKVNDWGLAGTATAFEHMDVPAPTVSAWFAAIVELGGGAALILGLALPVAGVLLAVDMAGAFLFVHAEHGVFVTEGGYELVLALGAGALAVGFNGGAFALDRLLAGRKEKVLTPA